MKKLILLSMLWISHAYADRRAVNIVDWKNPELAIQVALYRGYPGVDSFTALNEMGIILVQETGKGFVVRSVVDRDDVHPGATFCLQVSPGLFDAKEQLARILRSIKSLKPDGQFVEFRVENPSPCLSKYFR